MHQLLSQGHTGHVLKALQNWPGAQEVGGHLFGEIKRAPSTAAAAAGIHCNELARAIAALVGCSGSWWTPVINQTTAAATAAAAARAARCHWFVLVHTVCAHRHTQF
jgi:hypothetical protein